VRAGKLKAIIRRAIAGSPEDIEQLLSINAQAILYHAHRMIPDRATAQDAAQDVAMAVIEGIGTLKSPHAFSAWLHQITVRTCLKHLESIGQQNEHQCQLDQDIPVADEDRAVVPEAAMEEKDGWLTLYGYICRLPRAQHEVLVMRYYDQMSYKDIAKLQGVSMGAVSRNIANAKKSLKAMINNEGQSSVVPSDRVADAAAYGAVGFGGAITEAFRAHASTVVPAVETESFMEFCQQALQICLPSLGAAGATVGSALLFGKASTILASVGGKLALATASISLVGVTVGVAVQGNLQIPSDDTIRHVSTLTYTPSAEILFDGVGDGGTSLNPAHAELVLRDGEGRAVAWTVSQDNGVICQSGEGVVVDGLSDLAPGEYNLEWEVTNAQGVPARISRTFIIDQRDAAPPADQDISTLDATPPADPNAPAPTAAPPAAAAPPDAVPPAAAEPPTAVPPATSAAN
jgi:RNA polymerase sigma-70 factor (ECF subfamily)